MKKRMTAATTEATITATVEVRVSDQVGQVTFISSLVAIAITAALIGGAWASPRIRQLAFETASELMRVTWPSWGETKVSTIAVIVASVVAGLILFFIDTLSYKLMVEWLPALWGKL